MGRWCIWLRAVWAVTRESSIKRALSKMQWQHWSCTVKHCHPRVKMWLLLLRSSLEACLPAAGSATHLQDGGDDAMGPQSRNGAEQHVLCGPNPGSEIGHDIISPQLMVPPQSLGFVGGCSQEPLEPALPRQGHPEGMAAGQLSHHSRCGGHPMANPTIPGAEHPLAPPSQPVRLWVQIRRRPWGWAELEQLCSKSWRSWGCSAWRREGSGETSWQPMGKLPEGDHQTEMLSREIQIHWRFTLKWLYDVCFSLTWPFHSRNRAPLQCSSRNDNRTKAHCYFIVDFPKPKYPYTT